MRAEPIKIETICQQTSLRMKLAMRKLLCMVCISIMIPFVIVSLLYERKLFSAWNAICFACVLDKLACFY